MTRLDEIKERMSKASKGSWVIRDYVDDIGDTRACIIAKGRGNLTIMEDMDDDDAVFVVESFNNDTPFLVAEVERLRAALEWIALCPCPNDYDDCGEYNGGDKSCGECMSDKARAALEDE